MPADRPSSMSRPRTVLAGAVVVAVGLVPMLRGGGADADGLSVSSLVQSVHAGDAVRTVVERATVSAPAERWRPAVTIDPTNTPTGAVADDGTIRVDQFGYLPSLTKVATIVNVAPGGTLQVVDRSGAVVLTDSAQAWNGGAVDPQSGDRAWLFDFSAVQAPGEYRIVDAATGRASGWFEIGNDVYVGVLDAAMRVFYFNRGNVVHDEQWAGEWNGPATVDGPGQDSEARWVDARDDASTARDLSGGWFDAGDTNKYVTFAVAPVHQLLDTYGRYPGLFDDAFGIPESGNGIPDLLDEVRIELEWLEKMQNADGSMLVKVGFVGYDDSEPIDQDRRPRFYEEACSSSTIAGAGMFAHAASIYESVDGAFANRLRQRAIDAFDRYEQMDRSDSCDPQIVNAGDADLTLEGQDRLHVVAAVHLFDLTGDDRYDQVVRNGFDETRPFLEQAFGRYDPADAIALARYLDLPGRDQATADAITALVERVTGPNAPLAVHGFDPSLSPYRSYLPDEQYHWGSNMVMANTGWANAIAADIVGESPEFTERAASHLHNLHGVNAMGLVYLTNMYEHGAERSANEMYHYWFKEDTVYDNALTSPVGPAPGYLTGGPNSSYSGTATPPLGQPLAKSYFDSNTTADLAWEITEPAIYYQSAYVALLASVVANSR